MQEILPDASRQDVILQVTLFLATLLRSLTWSQLQRSRLSVDQAINRLLMANEGRSEEQEEEEDRHSRRVGHAWSVVMFHSL